MTTALYALVNSMAENFYNWKLKISKKKKNKNRTKHNKTFKPINNAGIYSFPSWLHALLNNYYFYSGTLVLNKHL